MLHKAGGRGLRPQVSWNTSYVSGSPESECPLEVKAQVSVSSQKSQCPRAILRHSRRPEMFKPQHFACRSPILWNKILSSHTQGESCFKCYVSFRLPTRVIRTGGAVSKRHFHFQNSGSLTGLAYLPRAQEKMLSLPFPMPGDFRCCLSCGCIASNSVVFK